MSAPGSIIRLFVSSTFADFAVERDVLQRVVFPRIRQLCAEQGFRFQPIDLRWGVSQEAGNEKRTLTICFEEIRRCQELSPDLNFLILLGDRYGSCFLPASIPSTQVARLLPHLDQDARFLFDSSNPAVAYREDLNAVPAEYVLLHTPPDGRDEEGLRLALAHAAHAAGFSAEELQPFEASATHLEIQRGLLAVQADPDAVLCAVRTFAPTPSGSNVQPYTEHDPARQAQVKTLHASVEERLAGRVARYTVRWDARGPVIDREALSAHLLALLESRVREVIALRNQAAQGRDAVADANEHFTAERTAHFVGRAEALQAIARELADASGPPLVITGASGAGKSTLLAEAMRRAELAHPTAVLVTRFIGITPGTSSLRDLLVGVRREIAARYGQEVPDIPAEDAQLIAEFPGVLAAAMADRPLLLVVDALDQLGAAPQRVDWLPTDLPLHVHVIVSVLPDRPELERLRERLGGKQIVRLGALAPAEGAESLDHWLADARRDLQPAQRQAVLSSFAVEGLPLYLRLACEQMRSWPSFQAAPTLPPTIPELLSSLFSDLARDDKHGPVLVAHALGNLGAAKNGLAEDEVLDVLGQDEQVSEDLRRLSPDSPGVEVDRKLPLPVVLWARLYADLQPYLTEREADGAQLITYFHRQLRDVVETQWLRGEDGLARHRSLAAYFSAQPLSLGDLLNRRLLSELPFQQANGEQWEALHTTLTNASFLEGKIADQGTSAAVADLALSPESDDIQRISAAIRAGAVVLSEAPDELSNQIQGHVGYVQVLHDPPTRQRPYFQLRTPSLIPADPGLVRTFAGHAREVRACAFSPDGRLALSGSYEGTLRLWDVATGESLRSFKSRFGPVEGCAFLPDGRQALTADSNRTLQLWDVTSGQSIRAFNGHSSYVWGCALSPDGRLALSASGDRTLRLWDVASGASVRTFTGHTDHVFGCAFSPDGSRVLSASDDGTLRLWDVASGETLRTFAGHAGWVRCCGFSPDGRLAISGSDDDTLRLWDVESGECVRSLTGHTARVTTCAFDPDGHRVLSASDDRTARLWDVASGRELHIFRGHTAGVNSCALSPDGRLALSASGDRTLRLWDVASGHIVRTPDGHAEDVTRCVFSLDGALALSASRDGTLRLWDVESGETLHALSGHAAVVTGCAFSPNGKLALSSSADQTLRLWDVASGETLRCLTGHTARVTTCAFDPDGHRVLSASDDHTARLWDVASGETLRTFHGHLTTPVHGCAFSHDGRLALVACEFGQLSLWDVESGEMLRELSGHTGAVYGCEFSPNGQVALSCGSSDDRESYYQSPQDNVLRLWEVSTGEMLRTFEGHTSGVYGCAFSPDGRLALSASGDGTMRLWDINSGEEIARWLTDGALRCCAYGPDGRQMLAGDTSGGVHFLKLVGIEAMRVPPPSVPPAARNSRPGGSGTGTESASILKGTIRRGLFGWWRRR